MFGKKFKGSYVGTLTLSAGDAIDLANELDSVMKHGRYSVTATEDGKAVVTLLMRSRRDYDKLMKKLENNWQPVGELKDGTFK